jgi:hypothetical protein
MAVEPLEVRSRGGGRWLLLAALAAITCVGVGVGLIVMTEDQRSSEQGLAGQVPDGQAIVGQEKGGKLEGELIVFVRAPERGVQSKPVEDQGVLPARAGGIMSLQAQLNQPAFAYFVWLDTEGQAIPLYPWNTTTLEVKDIHQPPPVRRAAKLIDSPLLGGGWKFSMQDGMETVLLLARSTPLPEGTKLSSLLEPLPPPVKVREAEELVKLGLDGGAKSISTLLAKSRGAEEEAKAADEPLQALMLRLSEHFELIRAVRFAHLGE